MHSALRGEEQEETVQRLLAVEQIGSVYESLMGYHVVRVGSPAVRLGKTATRVAAVSVTTNSV